MAVNDQLATEIQLHANTKLCLSIARKDRDMLSIAVDAALAAIIDGRKSVAVEILRDAQKFMATSPLDNAS